MKDIHKKIFAVIFVCGIFTFSIYNFFSTKDALKEEIKNIEEPKKLKDLKQYAATIDTTVATNMVYGSMWNEAYGAIYNFVGKNEENGFKYVRDKQGFMFAGNFWNLPQAEARLYAQRIRRMQDYLETKGTKVVFMVFPSQYNEAWSDGYYGMPYTCYASYEEEFVSWLRYYGVDCMDFQEYYIENNRTQEELFYKTDHHWTVETAFEASGLLVEHLNSSYGENLDPYYSDIENYNCEIYRNAFIGSQGRDSGMTFSGLDDYTIIYPKFDTNFYYESTNSNGSENITSGRMDQTLITRTYTQKDDYYEKDLYSTYLNGVVYKEKIVNLNNPDGINCLFIRDSFASPMATFFSNYCNEMDLVWAARMPGDEIERTIANGNYDYVFVALEIDSVAVDVISFFASEEVGKVE